MDVYFKAYVNNEQVDFIHPIHVDDDELYAYMHNTAICSFDEHHNDVHVVAYDAWTNEEVCTYDFLFTPCVNELRRRFAYAESFEEFTIEAERALDAYVAGLFDAARRFCIDEYELAHIVECA